MKLEQRLEQDLYQWVFGLSWHPLLGDTSAQHIKLLCKQYKAMSWVVVGSHFMALGLSQQPFKKDHRFISAAGCFALLYPQGSHATVMQISDQLYWLAACHEGTPISHADQLFSSMQQAQQQVELLKQQYVHLVTQECSFDCLQTALTHKSAASLYLQRAKPAKGRRLIVFLLMGLLFVAYGWQQYFQPPLSAAHTEELAVDPYIEKWQQQPPIASNQQALLALWQHWLQLPLHLEQWQLAQVQCEIQTHFWLCEHWYKPRTENARLGGFTDQLPQGWTLKHTDLQSIQTTAHVHFNTLSAAEWHASALIRTRLVEQLQQIRPALADIKLANPQRWPLVVATTDTAFAPVFEQPLYLHAPLRSVVLLMDLDASVYWRKASLSIHPQTKASLKQSALQAQLHGVFYVRDEKN